MKNLYSTTKLIAILLVLFTLSVPVIGQDHVITTAGNVMNTADNSNNSDIYIFEKME